MAERTKVERCALFEAMIREDDDEKRAKLRRQYVNGLRAGTDEGRAVLARDTARPPSPGPTTRQAYRWRMRRFYWRHVRRYHFEICRRCGRPVSRSTGPTWWTAPDWLWNRVEGDETGIRCMPCFAEDCCDAGLLIHWTAVPPEESA